MNFAFDEVNLQKKDIYKIYILTEMWWFSQAWNDLPATLISNRWPHTKLCSEDVHIEIGRLKRLEQKDLQKNIETHESAGSVMHIASVLNHRVKIIVPKITVITK